jgi:hypothetical protein
MLKNRLKCLEITFKPDRRPIRYFGNEVEGVLPFEVSSVLFPLDNKDYAGSVITYDENSQWWILWLSTRSTDELDRMVEKYLEDSD